MNRPSRIGTARRHLPALHAAVALLAMAISAHGHGTADRPHPTGHVKQPQEMTWPPQPLGITDVVDLSDAGVESRRKARRDLAFEQLERRFSRHEATRGLVGRKLTRLSVEEHAEKDGPALERRAQYFDRRSNSTLTVREAADGSLQVTHTPADVYQPEITEEEVAEATALAKRHFLRKGVTRVKQLQGFGIQAYRPEGSGFFPGRVVYVSLHVDSDTDPEYVAWVDLTRGRVFNARKEVAR